MALVIRDANKEKLLPLVVAPIRTLLKVILMICMEYVGRGNFVFVAAVCKEFRECYVKAYSDRETSPKGFASDSLECTKMCFVNENKNFKSNLFC